MQDIVAGVDRLRDIFAGSATNRTEPSDAELVEISHIAIGFAGELVANSRRIATALEQIARNTETQTLEVVGAAVGDPVGDNTAALENAYFLAGQAFVNGRRSAGENI